MKDFLFIIMLLFPLGTSTFQTMPNTFVRIDQRGGFFSNGRAYYYISVNFCYGTILDFDYLNAYKETEMESISYPGIEQLYLLF